MEEEEWGQVGGAEEGDGGCLDGLGIWCGVVWVCFLVYTFDLRYPDGMNYAIRQYSVNYKNHPCCSFLRAVCIGSGQPAVSTSPPQNLRYFSTSPPQPPPYNHRIHHKQWTQDNPNPANTLDHLPPMATLTTTTNNNHNNAPPHPHHHEPPSPPTQQPQSPTRSSSKERTR